MTLGSGHGFGELALIARNKDTKRAATVTSNSTTHVAILKKKDF